MAGRIEAEAQLRGRRRRSPGEIVTPMNDDFYEQYPDFMDEAKDFTPAGRLGYPDDVVPTIVYLASEAAKFVYGVSIGQVAR